MFVLGLLTPAGCGVFGCSSRNGHSPASDIARLQQEKSVRTAAQQKLDSNIVLALKKSRREPPFDQPTAVQPSLTIRPDGSVLVDLDATVSMELLEHIARLGGQVVNSFAAAQAVRAHVPLGQLEALATRADIKFISPAAAATTNQLNEPRISPVRDPATKP